MKSEGEEVKEEFTDWRLRVVNNCIQDKLKYRLGDQIFKNFDDEFKDFIFLKVKTMSHQSYK